MLIKVPSLSWRPTSGSPFSCHPKSLSFPSAGQKPPIPCGVPSVDRGAEEETRTQVDLELELFPCKGAAARTSQQPLLGLTARLMDHTVRAGWQAPPPTSLCSPGSQTHLTRVASGHTPFCLLSPLSCLQGIKRMFAKAIMTPCLPMILFKALAIPFSHLICEAGRVGNSVPILQMTELKVALAK